jgi:branched-chain amino acid transport system substrate-binding protein
VDVRDGFQLALDMAGAQGIKLVVEDDAQRPELAVQIAERMIQSERADILTGIIWSNLAMAVVPSTVAQDIFYLSPNAGPSALAGANCHPNYFNVAWQNDMLHEGAGAYANELGYQNAFIMAPNYPAGTDALNGFKRYLKVIWRESCLPRWARPITRQRLRKSGPLGRIRSLSSCRVAWA